VPGLPRCGSRRHRVDALRTGDHRRRSNAGRARRARAVHRGSLRGAHRRGRVRAGAGQGVDRERGRVGQRRPGGRRMRCGGNRRLHRLRLRRPPRRLLGDRRHEPDPALRPVQARRRAAGGAGQSAPFHRAVRLDLRERREELRIPTARVRGLGPRARRGRPEIVADLRSRPGARDRRAGADGCLRPVPPRQRGSLLLGRAGPAHPPRRRCGGRGGGHPGVCARAWRKLGREPLRPWQNAASDFARVLFAAGTPQVT
jgi:hypothetical protein